MTISSLSWIHTVSLASIENMFHVSFLVKEGKVSISVCRETGLPMMTPKSSKNKGGQDEEEKNQVVMNMNMEDWRKMVREMKIKQAMITPVGVGRRG